MDVRAKQRLSYHVVFLTRSCVAAVSPHVISIVRLLLVTYKMIIDVAIKIDASDISVKSKVANYSENKPALIALSKERDTDFEQIEAIGETLTATEIEQDSWFQEHYKGKRVCRVINPFIPQTFEPRPASLMIDFFCRKTSMLIQPARGRWRRLFGFDSFDITLQIADYLLVATDKKLEFEKLLQNISRKIKIES